MKKNYYIMAILFLVIILLMLYLNRGTIRPLIDSETTNQTPKPTVQKNKIPDPVSFKNQQNPTNSSLSEQVKIYMDHKKIDPVWDWRQPINFYGKVVDENNEPVGGAAINYTWSDTSEHGTSKSKTESNSKGLFSIHQTGKRLIMDVKKDGYYTSSRDWNSYEYANPADGLFTPDPDKPVIFHLRKKGIGAVLITSQYGMSPDFPIHIPRDGTPVKIDFLHRKIDESGQMQIFESKPEYSKWKEATTWSFNLEIPDGGFVLENDEYPFLAPDSGYQESMNFKFQKNETNWTDNLSRDFYIKFGNPPIYGHLHLETSIMMGGARLTYAINPSGSPNLEPAN